MTILDTVVHNKIQEVEKLSTLDYVPSCQRNFLAAFSQERIGIIAELKAQSPSAGKIVENYSPVAKAKQYEQGGANAISILTDEKFFGGSLTHLQQVRAVVDLPLLCKDFFIDVKQVKHARNSGADACLLIVSILSDSKIKELKQAIEELDMTALIEIHDQHELERALAVEPKIIAINNRDLRDFSMDSTNAILLSAGIPAHVKVVSASGVEKPQQVHQLPKRINGVLIGTSLMKAADPIEFLKACR